MRKAGKPLPELYIAVDDLSQLHANDLRSFLAGVKGPKFITEDSKRGTKIWAVLISHEKWQTLSHNVPAVNSRKAEVFFVGEHPFMVIPAVDLGSGIYQAKSETGLTIITNKKSKKKIDG